MASSHSPDTRGSTAASSVDLPRLMSRSSARFGSLSHHSFFSRHNPHPSRVRHIQGLNGRPVCSVRDDWFGSSPLFPHPLLKANIFRRAPDLPLSHSLLGTNANKSRTSFLSERWREELKELTTRISLTSQPQKDKKEEEPLHRQTQYSTQTGRLIPSSSTSSQSRSHSRSHTHPHSRLQHQELMVLELLCQILQTDSLSNVQQWLLLAGQREKDLVMGMIKQALDGTDLQNPDLQNPDLQNPDLQNPDLRLCPDLPPQYNPTVDPTWRPPPHGLRFEHMVFILVLPDRIGEAEVLQILEDTKTH
ncbi:protein TBATA [Periophthalmus magnuspinnatus]|uniref:protein TBATA n=1 Tax=Periophthalmus magnuspinnatus TaxID=409849 RepID=UPI0024366F1A|nr:protein TBATA [Periophthalmus magnuspinnatus]